MTYEGPTWQWSKILIGFGVFFVSFLEFRAPEMLFTLSDFFFMVGGALFLLTCRLPTRPFSSLTGFWYLAFGLMISGLLVSSLANDAAIRWVLVTIQYAFAFIFIALLLLDIKEHRWLFFARALIAGVVVMEVLAIGYYFYSSGVYNPTSDLGVDIVSGAGRLVGFIGNPNQNGAIVAMCLPFVFFFRSKRLISFPVMVFVLAVFITALILTASVTGLFTAVLGAVLYAAASRNVPSWRYGLLAIIAVPIVMSMDITLPRAFENRIAPALESGNIEEAGTYTGRYDLIVEAWSMTDENFLVGLGVDQFRVISDHKAPVHNSLLLLWVEGGFISAVSWIAMMGVLGFGCLAAIAKRPQQAALGLSVLIIFFVYSMTATHMYARSWVVPLLLAVGPAFAPIISRKNQRI